MAVDQLNTTTLSEALSADANEFTVASTASIAVGDLIVCRQEAMEVQEIPVSGRVKVLRGVSGTFTRAAASGQRIFTGTPDKFKAIQDSATALVGNSGTFPDFLLPGQRAADGAGNVYVLVDLTATVVPGATVVFSRDGLYTASILTSTSQGSVGIIMENATSAQYAWAQVEGVFDHAKLVGGSSLVTSLGELWGASSVSTPSVGLLGRSSSQRSSAYLTDAVIWGMWPTSSASTASTSASSETGLFASVYLQNPYILRTITS